MKNKPNSREQELLSKTKTVPFILLVIYFFFDYFRPHDQYPIIASIKISLIISIAILFIWIKDGNKRAFNEPLIKLNILFLLIMISGIFFAKNNYWLVKNTQNLATFFLIGVLPVIAFLDSPNRFREFIKYWIAIHVMLAYYGITHAGKGPGGSLGDENDLALALNMSIPYAFFLFQSPATSFKGKIFYAVALIIIIYAVVMTDSRGGFIGLVAAVAGIILFSKHLFRNILIVGISIPIFLSFVSPTYLEEMESIQDAKDETRQDRLYSWRRGWEMFLENPILGVGAGNYPWNVEEYELKSDEYDPRKHRLHGGRVSHSLYFTLIPELGSLGIIVYMSILLGIYVKLRKISSDKLGEEIKTPELIELKYLSRAMMASLMAFLVCGTFISVLYYQHFWYLVGFSVALSYAYSESLRISENEFRDKDNNSIINDSLKDNKFSG